MATLGTSGKVTLLDVAKSVDPNGNTADVAELLSQTNEILLDMPFYEGNLPTGHESTVRTGLPVAIWRQMYQGVPASKSARAKVVDSAGNLETRSEVDKDVAKLNGNESSFRLSEADAFIESMNQTMAQSVIYGNTAVNPERFMGLAPRFNSLAAANGQNIVNAGGVGADNTSVWLVVWGSKSIFGMYPKGTKAGLTHQDLGEIDAFDANNNRYRALADLWNWKCGLVVKDWRYAVRVANIDVSDLIALTGTQAITASTFILRAMTRAMARIPFMGKGSPVFYANRTVKEMLSIAAQEKGQNVLSVEAGVNQLGAVSPGSVNGGTLKFLGVPIRTVDQITLAETVVS